MTSLSAFFPQFAWDRLISAASCQFAAGADFDQVGKELHLAKVRCILATCSSSLSCSKADTAVQSTAILRRLTRLFITMPVASPGSLQEDLPHIQLRVIEAVFCLASVVSFLTELCHILVSARTRNFIFDPERLLRNALAVRHSGIPFFCCNWRQTCPRRRPSRSMRLCKITCSVAQSWRAFVKIVLQFQTHYTCEERLCLYRDRGIYTDASIANLSFSSNQMSQLPASAPALGVDLALFSYSTIFYCA